MSNQTGSRMQWIDAVKGIGITLMILGHMSIGENLLYFIYSFHMPIFIVISGYLFRRDVAFADTVKRKARTLLLPYLYANVAVLCVRWGLLFAGGSFSWEGAFGIAKMQTMMTLAAGGFYRTFFEGLESVGPIWFIPFLFCINMIFLIFSKLRKGQSRMGDIVETLIVILLSFLGYYIGTEVAFLPWSFDAALVALIMFYTGMLLKKYGFFENKYGGWIAFALGVFWIVSYQKSGFVGLVTRSYDAFPFCIVVALAASIFIMYVVRAAEVHGGLGWLLKPLAWCGRNSMLLLIIHTIESCHIKWIDSIQIKIPNLFFAYVAYMSVIVVVAIGVLYIKKLIQRQSI